MTSRILVTTALLFLSSAFPLMAAWEEGFDAPPGGLGLNGDPRALLHHSDDRVYCGGSFNQAGSTTTWFGARLVNTDGIYSWESLGDMDNRIDAFVSWGDSVLAGGRFTVAGGEDVNRVAVFHDGEWASVGDPAAWSWGNVLSLTMHDGSPWAAGSGFVVRWTGTAWEAVTGPAFSGDVFALASFDGALYATGAFATLVDPSGTSTPAANIASWDGIWSPLGSGLNGTGYALLPWNDQLVVGGVFTSPGPLLTGWTGVTWISIGDTLNGNFVIALADWGTRLLIGGDLGGGGGVPLWDVAYLDGAIWNGMDGGVDAQVRALSASGTEVLVGGSFLNAGETAASHVGVWSDPTVAVGDGPPTAVLDAPSPNPFNPAVTITFRLQSDTPTVLSVHALDGRRVATLTDGPTSGGTHRLTWHGRDDAGRALPSGSYLVRLVAGSTRTTRLITLLR